MWTKKLDELASTRVLVDVWRDSLKSEPITGVVALRSDQLLALQEVNDDAEYDGVEILQVNDITRVGWGDRELESVQQLMISSATVLPDVPRLDLTSKHAAIASVQEVFGYVAIRMEEFDAGYHFGEVLELDETSLHLRAFGAKRSLDRYDLLVDIATITRIEVDGKYERRLLSLFNNR